MLLGNVIFHPTWSFTSPCRFIFPLVGFLCFFFLSFWSFPNFIGIPKFSRMIGNNFFRVGLFIFSPLSYNSLGHGVVNRYVQLTIIVQGIECFWLTILPLPICIIDGNGIYSLCRKFIWPTKRPPIAWEMLCKPIEAGGLGLKNLKAWNKALIAKTLWKIHLKKDCLWIKQIIGVRDEMIMGLGSKEAATVALVNWFGGTGGSSLAYDFFVQRCKGWPWKPLIAKNCILPKHRFMLWLLAHRKLLTRNRLTYLDDKSCVLCNGAEESVQHLYFICPIARSIWNGIREWLGMRKIMGSPTAVLNAFRGIYRGNLTLNRMRCAALAATVYHVWSIRNRVMFDNAKPNVEEIIKVIKIHVFRCIPRSIEIFQPSTRTGLL